MNRIILLLLTFVSFSVLAQQPELIVQSGHSNLISDCKISSNNQYLITGGVDEGIKVWDFNTGKLLRNYSNEAGVNCLAFFPNQNKFLSGSFKIGTKPLKTWDLQSKTYQDFGFENSVLDLDFSDSNKYFAVAGSGHVSLYDYKNGVGLRNYLEPEGLFVKTIDFSPDESLIAVGTSELGLPNFVHIWETNSDKKLKSFPFKYGVENVIFVNDSEVLVEINTWQNTNKVFRMNIESGEITDSFRLLSTTIFDNGKQVVGFTEPFTISVIDVFTGKVIREIKTQEKYTSAFAVSDDGKYLVATAHDIEKFDLETGNSIYYIKGRSWIDALSFTSKGNKLAFSSEDGDIINWDIESGEINRLQGHNKKVIDLFYDEEGNYLASASQDSTVIVWNNDGSIKQHWLFDNGDFNGVSINPSGDWVLVSHSDTIYSILLEEGTLSSTFSFDGYPTSKIIYSPNNIDVAAIVSDFLFIYDTQTDSFKVQFYAKGGLTDVSVSKDGKLAAVGGYNDSLYVIDIATSEVVFKVYHGDNYINSLDFDPSSFLLAVGHNNGTVKIYDIAKKQKIGEYKGHDNLINKLSFRNDGKVLASASWDGKLILWEPKNLEKKAELYVFEDGTWAVIDDDGRYDASNAGDISHLHWVVEEETIGLNQLKERYYEPGLLQKLLGYNTEELRDVKKLKALELYPKAKLFLEDGKLEVWLIERNGGIGKMPLFINNKEVAPDLSSQLQKKEEGIYFVEIDINQYDKFLKVGENEISIKVNNRENYLSGPKVNVNYSKSGFGKLKTPALYGIIIGTADYRGEQLDLQFADKDAERFYDALNQTGAALFGANNTFLHLLNTNEKNTIASKENIKEQFSKIANNARADDAFVVYLSGHGVNFHSENEDQFYYLTKDIESGNLTDSEIRKNYAISTSELTDWINSIPAEKQVLIIDACASGQVIEDIMVGTKAVSSSQIRAIERMKDRTGMFVLAGSASNQVSYEASQFGQSLLTYSLLAGMKGQALRDNEFIDIAKLFEYSIDQVPQLASFIGGIQKPIIAIPYGGNSFDIGKVDESTHIDLPSIKPIFIRSNFQDEFDFADVLGISNALDSELRDFATKGNTSDIIFVDVSKYPEAYSIKGRYQINEDQVEVKGKLFKDREALGTFEITGSKDDIATLIDQIMEEANALIGE